MSRQWFWPLVGAGCLCLSIAGGLVLGVVLTRHFVRDVHTAELNGQDVGVVVYYVTPVWTWISAAILGAGGLASLALASRLR